MKRKGYRASEGLSSSPEIQVALSQAQKGISIKKRSFFIIAMLGLASMVLFASALSLLRERGYVFKGDGLHYYVYLHSTFYDHDFDFTKEFKYFSSIKTDVVIKDEASAIRAKNKYPIGTALLIAPFYYPISAMLAPWLSNKPSLEDFPWLLDQALFSLGGILIGSLGLWLSYLFVSYYFPHKETLIATTAFWACSPLLYYFIREPYMSHLPAMFCTAFFLVLWKAPFPSLHMRAFLMCIAGALALITRPQDVLVLLVPLTVFVLGGFKIRKDSQGRLRLTIILCCLGVSAICLAQMAVWHLLYGQYLVNPYFEEGEHFIYYKSPYIFSVLFSSNHGLISWHPLSALCLSGLLFAPRVFRRTALALLVWFAANLYVTASWHGWSMGVSFGNRAFISLTPMFIFGLTAFLTHFKSHLIKRVFFSVVGLLFVWNITLVLAYLSELIPYNGTFSWWDLIKQIPELHLSVFSKIARL